MHRAKRRRHETKGASSLTQPPFINSETEKELHSEDDSPREVMTTAYHTLIVHPMPEMQGHLCFIQLMLHCLACRHRMRPLHTHPCWAH